MTNLRLWILLLALTAFGAGVGLGWAASNRTHAAAERARNPGPFDGFQRQFETVFRPSEERSRLLGELLANYQREIEVLEQAQLESARAALERELEKLALTYRDRIRNSVLPPDQRAEYDRLALGVDWKANN